MTFIIWKGISMELYQLHCFKVVAEYQSITKAAEALHVSQPSLSQTIHRLEKELGYPLFIRLNKKIQLNQTGEVFFERVCHIEQYMDNTLTEMNEINNIGKPVIFLQVSCASMFLTDLLVYLKECLPMIEFRIHQLNTSNKYTEKSIWIVAEQIDEQDVVLLKEDIRLVLPTDHPLAMMEKLYLADLVDEKFFSLSENWSLFHLIKNELDKKDFIPHIIMQFDNPILMRAVLNKKLGVAFVPSVSWNTHNTNKLILRRVEDFKVSRKIYLHKPNGFLTRKQHQCIEKICTFFREQQNLYG